LGLATIFVSALLANCKEEESGPPSGPGNFVVTNGNINLATKLWLPGNEKYPVVIIVEGSQADPKEEFEANALAFTVGGMAVLAYDKRGHFESTGPELTPTVANSMLTFRFLASDVVSIVEFLKTHQNIDSKKIGLFCSSQGVWVGAQAQALTDDIAFAVNVNGSATSVGIEDYYSQLTGNDLNGNNLSGLTISEIDAKVTQYEGPHGFDPLPYLHDITSSQLWILGEMDFGNPTRQSVVILNNLITTMKKDITIIVVPNANHSLIDITNNQQISIGELVTPWFTSLLKK